MPHAHTQPACCSSDFGAKYELFQHPEFRALERAVLGCDYGGTSWTTREQADAIAPLLNLTPDRHFLEIGAGSGWPAVYLARSSAAPLTLLDLPLNALDQARSRVQTDQLPGQVEYVSASGTQLPFRNGTFDAIGHSDVLCCLAEKPEMMGECRRVARRGATMVFFVIAPAAGLSGNDLERALETGPPFVGLKGSYAEQLTDNGWTLRSLDDLTGPYGDSLQKMIDELEARAAVYSGIMGEAAFVDEVALRRRQRDAVRDGLLLRERYVAIAT